MANPVDKMWQESFLPDLLFGSDDHNQQTQPDPIGREDVEANPTPGSDPILGSDKADTGVQVGDASHAPAGQIPDPEPVPGSDPLLGSDTFIVADPMDGAGGSNQTPIGKTSEAKRAKRSRKGKEVVEGEALDWLPSGWTMTCKTRTNGATAGIVDRYYIEPTKSQRFRSKAEVKRFLETRSKSKSMSDVDTTPSHTITKGQEKATKTKNTVTPEKQEAPRSFDYEIPPEEVIWSLVDGNRNLWKPSIGGEPVPEATVQEWKTTFEHAHELN